MKLTLPTPIENRFELHFKSNPVFSGKPANNKSAIFPPKATQGVNSNYYLLNFFTSLVFLYLMLPTGIFLLGYLKFSISIPIFLLTVFSLYRCFSSSVGKKVREPFLSLLLTSLNFYKYQLILLGILTFGWLMLSSIGGIGYRNFDSPIRSSLLWHLTNDRWPVWFSADYMGKDFGYHTDKPYVYYFAYYLPAAAAGKIFGWTNANLILFSFSCAGVFLSIVIVSLYKAKISHLQIIFMFLAVSLSGGMDYVANLLLNFTADQSEMWGRPLLYFSNTRNLFWSPQHCIPCWLTIGILLNRKQLHPFLITSFPLVIASLILWTPLCVVGLIPFLIPVLFENAKTYLSFSLLNLVALLTVIILTLFILSNDFSFPVIFLPNILEQYWLDYTKFVLIEILPLGTIVLWSLKRKNIFDKQLIITALVCLLLIPFIMLGTWNDWSIKVSMPSIFICTIFTGRQVVRLFNKTQKIQLPVLLLFSLVSLTALEEMAYSVSHYQINFGYPPEIRDFGPGYIVKQQLGKDDSFFFKYLAK